MGEISDLPRGAAIPLWMPNRLNARYADALWLAHVVLAAGSVEQNPGSVRLDGFLLDVYKIYEEFVTSILGTALEDVGGECTAQDNSTLDEEADIPIRSDLVWRVDGAPAAVIDAKYKAEKPSGFAQADLYQALAYAISYGLDRAHLVYAKGNEPSRTWTVRGAKVEITAHTLDLNKSPQAILAQISEIACRIASMSPSAPKVRAPQITR